MKIIEILSELGIGGAERHVVDLANELASRGHEITVISAGGKMEKQLSPAVRHIEMPVHRKNPFTILSCARKLAALARAEKTDVIRAYSRVPARIARRASRLTARLCRCFRAAEQGAKRRACPLL